MRFPSKGIFIVLFLSQFLYFEGRAQTVGAPLASGYYVVVAAYRLGQDTYAQNYINRISKHGIDAKYGADTKRNFLYVYLDYFEDFDASIKEMLETRKKAGFEEAWVRIMKGELDTKVEMIASTAPVVETKEEPEAVPNGTIVEVPQKTAAMQEPTQPESNPEESVMEEEVAEVEAAENAVSEVTEEEIIEEDPITEPKPVAEASVYLSLFNATNNNQIEGEVEVIDIDRARLVEKVKGNEYTTLPDPKSKTGRISLIANVFGYRPVQHTILYGQVPNDSTSHFMEWAGNHYVVKFDMVRYHKGDINTLYNVFFYNDAAIMLPESKYQLNNLLTMMQENPNYRIMLHGHTNGNSRGRIITMGPSKSFFALANDVNDGSGSAKELSKQRAIVIKEWLVLQGIAEDRIEVKAWGGGRMIHDKNSVNAKKNVRVDVEILEE